VDYLQMDFRPEESLVMRAGAQGANRLLFCYLERKKFEVFDFMQCFKTVLQFFCFASAVVFFSFALNGFPGASVLFAADSEGSRPDYNETAALMAEIPEDIGIVSDSIRPRPDKGKIAYVYENPNQNRFKVCMNDVCGPDVERVAKDSPVVSPDGNHWAALVQADGKARVMLNGSMSKAYDMVYGLGFSPDSMALSYIARADDTFSVYVNQDRQQAFAMIDFRQGLVYSDDSSRLAYVASKDGASWHVVHNGAPEEEAFDQIKHVSFSPDSKQMAYAAKRNGKWHLVKEGEKGDVGYQDIMHIQFGPDSRQLAFAARGDEGAFVVLDGEKSRLFDYLPGAPLFSPGGDRLAYIAAEERRGDLRMRMVVDDSAGPAYDQIGAYVFSPDGKQFAYMAQKGEKGMIVHDGDEQKAYDSVGIPYFCPQSRRLAYKAFQDEKWFMVMDGEKGPVFDSVDNPVFPAKGERMAYLAQIGGRFMVVEDGDIVGNHEAAMLLTFSPDGKHLAYGAAEDGESFLAVEGVKGEKRFLSFLRGAPLVFTENDAVQGIALQEKAEGVQEFWLIRAEIEK